MLNGSNSSVGSNGCSSGSSATETVLPVYREAGYTQVRMLKREGSIKILGVQCRI